MGQNVTDDSTLVASSRNSPGLIKGTKTTLASTQSYWSDTFSKAGSVITAPFRAVKNKLSSAMESEEQKADKELIKQYGFMKRVFTRASRLLSDTRDVEFQRSVLRALGQAALDEGAEWLLMHRERPLEHGRL